MSRFLLPIALATGLFASATYAQSEAPEAVTAETAAQPAEATAQPETQAQAPVQNPYDPMSWMQAGQGAMPMNLAHPQGWAMFIDPRTHTGAHVAFANPATYAQFMQPHFWMQFLNPDNMMAWMNPASYATFMNPATYLGWMNPAAYMHMINPATYTPMMNPASYMAFMNPMTYMQWMNPGAYAVPGTGDPQPPVNWFDPATWPQYGQAQGEGEQAFDPFDPSTSMTAPQPEAKAETTAETEAKE